MAVLKAGAKIQNIVAVTFTQKAAGELKLKLREELDQERHGHPAVEEALKYLEEASINTIHAFCAQILRERPVEAKVDPAFEELNEQESGRLYKAVLGVGLEQRLNTDSPGLRRAFAHEAARLWTILRPSNSWSGLDASWWSGAIIRREWQRSVSTR